MGIFENHTFTYGNEGWGDVLTSINGVGVQSDEIGNITNDGTWTYTWKNGRQLASMENDIEEWVFSYDASGMRTARTDGIVTYNYTYEGTQLVQMTYAGYALIFTYGINGHPMSVNFNGVDYYYMTNALGDVIGILDGNGNEVVTYIYDAWGNPLPAAGSMAETLGYLNPLRYRGYVYDEETKLYYLQSRYYNPDICRFISADSISYLGADGTPISYNLFAYCRNNPVMYSDNSGHSPASILLQFAVSLVGYIGVAVASIWNEDVRADMNAIRWNPFNSNETLVLNSNSVSFYKGQFVVREDWAFTNGRSGSIFIMFLNNNETDPNTVGHEWGHFVQLAIMGVSMYIPTIAIPSILSEGRKDYYSLPWERTADYLGGVDRGNYREGSLLWGLSQFILGPASVLLYEIFN